MANSQSSPLNSGLDTHTTVRDVDEATPLIPELAATYETDNGVSQDPERGDRMVGLGKNDLKETRSVATTISVLLIGVFISQTDAMLVFAIYGKIASDFHDLESGSWLISSYILAMCVSQPLFGKISDIFGRKKCLQVAYTLFAVGTVGAGLGKSMVQIIVARAVQGTGGAGMVCMVSILLTDLLPFHEVALYRSYVNVVQTAGRSCGGVIGGILASTIGWRWAFLIQVPPVILSIALVQWKLEEPQKNLNTERIETNREKLRRVDFVGAISMSVMIFSALFMLDTGGQKYSWKHPIVIAAGCTAVVGAGTFSVYERFFAKEPIFPIQLLTRYVVVTSYIIFVLQTFTQAALIFIIPLYFQATMNASTGEAGAYLIPSVIGNTIGGLLTGAWIKRTGCYKYPTILASVSSASSFTLLIMFWRGHTSVWGSFLIMPAGLATGIAHSAVFVGLTSAVAENEVAIAGSGLYLCANVGSVSGVSGAAAVFQITLQTGLIQALKGRSDASEIIRKAMSDISFVQHLDGGLRELLMPAYIHATQQVFVLSLVVSVVAFVIGLVTKENNLLKR